MTLYMIEIRTQDYDKALAWYRDVLGLTIEVEDRPNRFVTLKAGGARVSLKEGKGAAAGRDAVNLAFEVEDLDAMVAKLKSHGVEVGDPFESPYQEGYREARTEDPDGTRVRLFHWTRNH
jgi:predicted enzyme related to lactoylglutathione lyase